MSLLTILIPAYNEDKYILETLQSVKDQTFKDFNCIISDNASSDETGRICRNFVKDEPRFQYIKQKENMGSGRNIKFLSQQVKTEYSMIFSGHDVLEPTFVEKTLHVILNNPKVSFVFSKAIGINEESQLVNDEFMHQSYNFTGNSLSRYIQSVREVSNCTIFQSILKTDLLQKYNWNHDTLGDDHIFISYCLWHGELYNVDEVLYKRRLFKKRDSTDEGRFSGPKKEYQLTRSFYRMYEGYIENFNSLYDGPEEFRTFLNSKILDLLTAKYGIGYLYDDQKKESITCPDS
jgi:glycosyltransferase involved in cell wall biosynthesis